MKNRKTKQGTSAFSSHNLLISGPRLKLRPFVPDDMNIIPAWYENSEAASSRGLSYPLKFSELNKLYNTLNGRGMLFILEDECGEPIGDVTLLWVVNHKRVVMPPNESFMRILLFLKDPETNSDERPENFSKEIIWTTAKYLFEIIGIDSFCVLGIRDDDVKTFGSFYEMGFRIIRYEDSRKDLALAKQDYFWMNAVYGEFPFKIETVSRAGKNPERL